ncbi:YbaB/EbfC family nucleoid-associated protein [Streptomyces xiaopingdaonensis]|uniref:YbaB/EbfC family nucleoid-associated protein n=1 Tax=Streptomyces xiaopingdaonensis TaxID=1565415 RepID=UPI0002F831F9|nr:YbaB/EbfC family nucleoid-associated protein [Streptomyces xiaopingdaonensis]
MPDSLEQRLAQAQAELEATEKAVARTEQELRDSSFDAYSSDRSVRATVGPQGELTDLTFLDGKYRGMGAQELAASVLEAAQEARTRMHRHVMALMAPLTEASSSTPELPGLEVDWAKLFGPEVLEQPAEKEPAEKRAPWQDALRDDEE